MLSLLTYSVALVRKQTIPTVIPLYNILVKIANNIPYNILFFLFLGVASCCVRYQDFIMVAVEQLTLS
jgi:hypothetical protein